MGLDMGKQVSGVTKAEQRLAWLQHESILEHKVTKWTIQEWMLTKAQRDAYVKLQRQSITASNDSNAQLASRHCMKLLVCRADLVIPDTDQS